MADERRPANMFRYRERLVERTMEHQPRSAGLGRLGVSCLHLTQDLGLADNHRFETGAYPKQMTGGRTPLQMKENLPEPVRCDTPISRKKEQAFFCRALTVRSRGNYLHSIAGCQQRGFHHRWHLVPEPQKRWY